MKKIKILLCLLLALIVLCGAAFGVYTADYYRMDETAAALCASADGPSRLTTDGGRYLVFDADGAETGLIFYPGGKVEYGAYAPLMAMLQSRGVLCVLCEMPFHLAVFRPDAAAGVAGVFPEVSRWYIGGHSLGGVMAAEYAAKHPGDFEGLLLLAAYSTADLSGSGLKALSVRGSDDGVLNRDAYEDNRVNLPADARELVMASQEWISAFFGNYGEQKGDGVPAVSRVTQLTLTADAAAEWMLQR